MKLPPTFSKKDETSTTRCRPACRLYVRLSTSFSLYRFIPFCPTLKTMSWSRWTAGLAVTEWSVLHSRQRH